MFSRLSPTLKQRLLGLRTQMLIFFTAGMAIVLTASVLLTSNTTYETIGRINRRNSMAELKLVASALEGVNSAISRQASSILYADYFPILRNRARYSALEQIYAIRSFYDDVSRITINFPYIHSIYLFPGDSYALCATGSNMQRFQEMDLADYPSLSELLSQAGDRTFSYTGGVFNDDLPFLFSRLSPAPTFELISACRRVGDLTLLINLYADQIADLYARDGAESGLIRVLNPRGEIVSSALPAETGTLYGHAEQILSASEGLQTLGEADAQLVWITSDKAPLIVLSEVALGDYWRDFNAISRRMLTVITVGFLLTCLTFWYILGRAFRPVEKLRDSMARAGVGDLGGILPETGLGELRLLTHSYNEMLRNIRDLTERTAQAESERRLTELKALRNQINPHFLFNTLNTIRWMCLVGGNENAADCIVTLRGILAPMFRSDAPYCTLEEEAQSLRLFVRIMNARLGGGIALREEMEEAARTARVLRLLLQPIAENAITHGFEGGRGEIRLCARVLPAPDTYGQMLEIRVHNDGKPLPADELDELNRTLRSGGEAKGIGLLNTARRLYLQYGPGSAGKCPWAGIRMENASSGGVTAVIELPFLPDSSNS